MKTPAPDPRRSAGTDETLLHELQRLVTQTHVTYREIGQTLGVKPAWAQRRARKEGWLRPSRPRAKDTVPAAPCDPEARRRGFAERMWRIAERHLGQLEQDQQKQPHNVAARDMIGLVQAVDKLTALAASDATTRTRKSAGRDDAASHDYARMQPLQGIAPERFVFNSTNAPVRDLETLAIDLEYHLQEIRKTASTPLPVPEAVSHGATMTMMRELAGIADIWRGRRAGG